MTFQEIIPSLLSGSHIRRPSWKGTYHIEKNLFVWISSFNEEHYNITIRSIRSIRLEVEDLQATDWKVEEIEEKLQEKES